jgi:hypothetical protein
MSTLTYTNQDLAHAAPAVGTPLRKPFWRRLFNALMEAQQRRAEHEIARYLAIRGGLLTDDMEREMMRRLTGSTRKPL